MDPTGQERVAQLEQRLGVAPLDPALAIANRFQELAK